MEITHLPDLSDVESRLRLDYQVVSLMRSPLISVAAFRNVDDLKAQRNPVTSLAEGHFATHYRVDYHLRTLTGPGTYSQRTSVHFDLFANGDYPVEEPTCWVIDSEMPWSPHFSDTGWICIGKIWERRDGHMLLGELIVHVAKLLNFDEPEYNNPSYEGFSREAVEYWTTELKRQPLTKNLRYPMIPSLVPDEIPAPPPQPLISLKKQRLEPASRIRIRSANNAESPGPSIRIRPNDQVTQDRPRIKITR